MAEINIVVSAIAGMGSFFSPCILPILPAFISYLSGTTLQEISNINKTKKASTDDKNIEATITTTTTNSNNKKIISLQKSTRINIFLNTVYFVLGFSLVFAVLGVALNSFLVNVGISFQNTLQIIGGIVIISFGMFLILSSKKTT